MRTRVSAMAACACESEAPGARLKISVLKQNQNAYDDTYLDACVNAFFYTLSERGDNVIVKTCFFLSGKSLAAELE